MDGKLTALLGASMMISVNVAAQIAPVAPVAPIAAPVNTGAVLRVGTEVPLATAEALTTNHKALKVGQRIQLQTAADVVVQNTVVVPAGSPAVGEITEVRNQGMWGKSGHFGARLLYMTVNGRQIRLSGAFDEKGTAGGIGAVAVSAIVFAPAGFFIKGTNAKMAVGTPVKAFVDEDVPLTIAAAAPAPLVVGAPAAPAALPAVQTAPAAQPTLTPASVTTIKK